MNKNDIISQKSEPNSCLGMSNMNKWIVRLGCLIKTQLMSNQNAVKSVYKQTDVIANVLRRIVLVAIGLFSWLSELRRNEDRKYYFD